MKKGNALDVTILLNAYIFLIYRLVLKTSFNVELSVVKLVSTTEKGLNRV